MVIEAGGGVVGKASPAGAEKKTKQVKFLKKALEI
jgi:hypothetical protein